MAIVNNQIGGPANVRINGKTLLMQGVKVKAGGSALTAVPASRTIAGMKAGDPEPWILTGTPVLGGKFSVEELYAVRNVTIGVDMGNGDQYVLKGASCATLPEHDSAEGTAGELTFLAMSGEKSN